MPNLSQPNPGQRPAWSPCRDSYLFLALDGLAEVDLELDVPGVDSGEDGLALQLRLGDLVGRALLMETTGLSQSSCGFNSSELVNCNNITH